MGGFGSNSGSSPHGPRKIDNTKLYELLEIAKDADAKVIKKAYRKKALKYHPDKGGDEKKFQEISKAYEILSDPAQRQIYDKCGMEGLDQGAGQGDPDDIFNMFFGGRGSQSGGARHRQVAKVKAIILPIEATLVELYQGVTKKLKVPRRRIRLAAGVTKNDLVKTCAKCKGSGQVAYVRQFGGGLVHQQGRCDACQGLGKIAQKDSFTTEAETKEFEVVIPPGAADGVQITFPGEGNEHPGLDAGAVVFVVQMIPHNEYHRDGDDLVVERSLSVGQALLGFRMLVEHLDGEKLIMESVEVTAPDTARRVMGKGMPKTKGGYGRGDLVVIFRVEFPKEISFEDKEALENIYKIPRYEGEGEEVYLHPLRERSNDVKEGPGMPPQGVQCAQQ